MKQTRAILAVFILATFVGSAFAGDKEDVRAVLDNTAKAFNSKDKVAYESALADEFQAFTSVQTPLLYETKASWMAFISGLWQLPSVTYNQQQNSIQVYNGDSAVANGYYIFTVVGKDGDATTVSGRATISFAKLHGRWMIVNYHFSNLF
jgi:ketosteroid isomerase-like protein